MYFTINSARGVVIETSPVTGETQADTEIKLYLISANGTLSLLSSDDNNGAGNFSKLVPFLSAGSYAIEVININRWILQYHCIGRML
jgi:hypothetical protein